MTRFSKPVLAIVLCIALILLATVRSHRVTAQTDALPSWNDGSAKQSIIEFVERVTTEGENDYVLPAERIAVFDNDGTLWAEQPLYTQITFALERVKTLAAENPSWRDQQPFKAVLEGDMKGVMAGGEHALQEIVLATHTGMTTAEFEQIVVNWLESARHPKTNRPYTQMVYQPMLELLDYLRANNFKIYIVSGGSIEFMRPWVERVYGIPPERVIGSSFEVKYEMSDNGPVLMRLPEVHFNSDKAGKPVGIRNYIGRRPIFAFGNSDGDLQMLQWTAAGAGARFMGLVHHTDGEREFAYDSESIVGRLDEALVEAKAKAWTVVDMKSDWKSVFPFHQE